MFDQNMKKEIIMEHYTNPLNRGIVTDKSYLKVNTNSESCIDNIDLYLKIEDDVIKDIHFEGEACAISTSATSIMIKLLIGKTVEEAEELMKNYNNMIEEKEYKEDLLEQANAYNDISKQPNRKKCALLSWWGIEKALKK